ncbi:MAG: holo-ACP synthase [Alphaproteobacteria bacterium]|jgi:holo-[acyl-carrier protein] synthase
MIVGIGCDLANINRFEKALAKFGGRFVNRVFSEREKAELARRERLSLKEHACAAAKRFAAKEACTKALGTGFRDGIFMRDIEIVHQPSGKPELYLQNGARRRLEEICGGAAFKIHVTMTDDYPWAQAFVIIEII